MYLSFLTPRVERLTADGRLESVHSGGALGRLRKPVVLLDRGLCTFTLLTTASLPRSKRAQAARLQARFASPYVANGVALVKAGRDFGIWWWDLEAVLPAIARRLGSAAAALRPESLAQQSGNGFRLVKLARGYEAQLWQGGSLTASAWRLERFDPKAWAAFTSLQRGVDAPETMPVPVTLPISFESEAFRFSTSEVSREQAIAGAAGGFALVACTVAAFLLGQGLQLRGDTQTIVKETTELQLETPAAALIQAQDATRRRLADFLTVEERTNPLSAAGAAIGIVVLHDLTPTALEVEEDSLQVTLPYAAVEKANELVTEFEQSGYFYNIEPRTEASSQSLIVKMRVRGAAPPLSAGA